MRLFLILLFTLLLSSIAYCDTWTIENDKVYYNDSKVYISAEPHTVWNEDVEIQLTSKIYTGKINVLFGFNTSQVTPSRH